MGGIGQEQGTQFLGFFVGEDGTPKARLQQARQIAGVIEVRVGEHHPVDGGGILRQRRPVTPGQVFSALEKAAIHQ